MYVLCAGNSLRLPSYSEQSLPLSNCRVCLIVRFTPIHGIARENTGFPQARNGFSEAIWSEEKRAF